MSTFAATVRVNNLLVKTQVVANSSYDAKILLAHQYGDQNIVAYPTKVN
jgi:hypothetical protein